MSLGTRDNEVASGGGTPSPSPEARISAEEATRIVRDLRAARAELTVRYFAAQLGVIARGVVETKRGRRRMTARQAQRVAIEALERARKGSE